jgi:membrane protein insertase Oxa1/YidC/SpoIIIJ
VAASPEQQAQKKMMQFMMPGMMLLFFYQAPSGLTLYIMTSTFVGVAEQRFIRRHIQKKRHLAEQTETRVSAPGKPARSARPKKPKGPNWVKGGK